MYTHFRDIVIKHLEGSLALLAAILVLLSTTASAKKEPCNCFADNFTRRIEKIAMRDGVKLHTEIYTPDEADGPLPIIFIRTPYNADRYASTRIFNYLRDLAEDGYIFAYQDIRGTYKSEGVFVMDRPTRDPALGEQIDEGTDSYDTIEWLINNLPNNNGKVGLMGISYAGLTTVMGVVDPHPAVAVASPQASPGDFFLGDDFGHNGAFRLSPAFGYSAAIESSAAFTPYEYDQKDTYEWFLDIGPLENIDKTYLQGQIPSWLDFMENDTYTQYWSRRNVASQLSSLPVPILNVAGWFDAEDFYGPLKIYEAFERLDEDNTKNFLVVGPWYHGAWARRDQDSFGPLKFDQDTSAYYREKIQKPFFAHYLKDGPHHGLAPVHTFGVNANTWRDDTAWPPQNAKEQRFYLQEGGELKTEKPSDRKGFDTYISDPARPIPYSKRPIGGFWQDFQAGKLWKVEDQRFVHLRPDVVSWQTEPFDESMTIAGAIKASIFASTTGTDSDWIVKVIDVYPEDHPREELRGYQLMIAHEILRGKFRNSFVSPEAVRPNKVIEYNIDMLSRHHTVEKGHRLMVQVQSTLFPLFDRNPQTFVSIPTASESDYKPATQKIFRSRRHPSSISIDVIED